MWLLLKHGGGIGDCACRMGLGIGEWCHQGCEWVFCQHYRMEVEFGPDSRQLVDVGWRSGMWYEDSYGGFRITLINRINKVDFFLFFKILNMWANRFLESRN